MAAKLDRIAADSTAPEQADRQLREVRRAWDFRFGLFPVTALRDAASMARCCRWTAATAALVHQPAARFAILSHRLRGLPLMSPSSGEERWGPGKVRRRPGDGRLTRAEAVFMIRSLRGQPMNTLLKPSETDDTDAIAAAYLYAAKARSERRSDP